MITNNDVSKLKKVFATKKDLKAFATKKDLKGFATKEDLRAFATKNDLKGLPTKEDIGALAEDIHTVINMIGDSLDKNKEQDDILDNHERRLDKLEDKTFSTTT